MPSAASNIAIPSWPAPAASRMSSSRSARLSSGQTRWAISRTSPNEDALSLVFDDTAAVRYRQVLRLRPHRDRHARQCGRALHRAARFRHLRPRRVRRELSAGRPERIRHGLLPVERPRHRSLRLCGRPLHSGPVQSRLLGAVTLRREHLGHQAHRSRHLCALRAGATQGQLCRRHRRTRAGRRRTTRGNRHGRCLGAHRGLVPAGQSPLRSRDLADDHRRRWPALSGRLLHARRDLSAVVHSRPRHRSPISASS